MAKTKAERELSARIVKEAHEMFRLLELMVELAKYIEAHEILGPHSTFLTDARTLVARIKGVGKADGAG